MSRIKIFDTTLRDGEQSPGCSMNLAEKLQVASQLERLGVDIIEAGFAISSPGDFESVKSIAELVKNCSVASLSRALEKDIDCAWEAVKNAAYFETEFIDKCVSEIQSILYPEQKDTEEEKKPEEE